MIRSHAMSETMG